MKTAKRLITLALSAATVLAVCIHVPAANENNVKKYNYYVPVGDSVAAGFDIDLDHNESGGGDVTDVMFGRVEGAYPDLIGKATSKEGEDNYHSLTTVGFRVKDLAFILGYDVGDLDEYEEEVKKVLKRNPQYFEESYLKSKNDGSLGEHLKNADLITFALGTNDLIGTIGIDILDIVGQGGETEDGGESEIDLQNIVSKLFASVVRRYAEFIKYYDICLDHIVENNANDPDVYLIGMYNPYENMEIIGDELGIISTLYSAVMTTGNTMMRAFALKYGYTYVDIRGVSDVCDHLVNGGFELDFKDLMGVQSVHNHPDYYGHEYIAELILAKMPDTLVQTSLRNGNLELKINGNDAGMYGFTKEENGWLIRDLDSGLYLTYRNGNITLTQNGTLWQYNGGFYTETTSRLGFLSGIARHYISWDAQGFRASRLKKNATLYKAV